MPSASEPGRSAGRIDFATAGLFVLVFLVGGLGIGLSTGFGHPFDVAYRALQLFVLDGSAVGDISPVNPILQVARLVAPAVTVLAVLVGLRSLFVDELRRFLLARARGHVIVCGDDASAALLARTVRAGGHAVVLLAPPEAPIRDERQEGIAGRDR